MNKVPVPSPTHPLGGTKSLTKLTASSFSVSAMILRARRDNGCGGLLLALLATLCRKLLCREKRLSPPKLSVTVLDSLAHETCCWNCTWCRWSKGLVAAGLERPFRR